MKIYFNNISGDTAYVGTIPVLDFIVGSGATATSLPIVRTILTNDTNITTSNIDGVVDVIGGSTLIEKGICWSTGSTPTILDNTTMATTLLPYFGSYTSNITGMTPDIQYYYRAYAINSSGVGYGSIYQTRTYMNITILDYDSNEYNIIKVGKQQWLAQNLKTVHLNDGTDIPLITNQTKLNVFSGYSWYNNDISNKDIYGALYTGYMVLNNKTAPIGTHIPTIEEFSEVFYYFGETTGYLKESGTEHWLSPNTGAINSSNFTLLPAGQRAGETASYVQRTTYGKILTSNIYNGIYCLVIGPTYNLTSLYTNQVFKYDSFPIRCLVDQVLDKAIISCDSVTGVTQTTADVNINISGSTTDVVSRGICYSYDSGGLTWEYPTILDTIILSGSGIGTFTAHVTGLTHNKLYYIRGFAENDDGLSYSNIVQFTTLL